MIDISFVIPAYNEEERLGKTLKTLRNLNLNAEIIVVNDGSVDQTNNIAKSMADHVISYQINQGKGYALQKGWQHTSGQIIVCVDADLAESAAEVTSLIIPVQKQVVDFTISIIQPRGKAGFGIVKKRAQALVYRKTGKYITAPLSGQRAFHRKWLPILLRKNYQRFGIDMQMTIDLLLEGCTYLEVPTQMTHREMGKKLKGMIHRLKQWIDIEKQYREAQS